ncbi:MAG: hypothetical protein AAGF14_03980, partial [Pseudomonadota bacterium]
MSELFLRLGIFPVLSIWMALFAMSAEAQVRNTTHTNADTPTTESAPRPGEPARPELHELSAEGLKGTVTVLRSGQPFPVGGSAFAQIKVSSNAKRKGIDAELVFRAETAGILKVSGGKVEVR